MTIQLFNTLHQRKETFIPGNPDRVTMYVCGPTVYNYAHIGNARPAVVFDTLYRLLNRLYPTVIYARNITDIDDKINKAAQEQGVDFREISRKYAEIYHEDMAALNCLKPDIEPWATDHIPEMIDMITRLIEGGHAYVAEKHVLFHVPSYARYGRLSHRDREDMIAGARVEVAPYKRDPGDFVLWKPSTPDLPGWDSPWGRGRPGWHIECSSMIEKHLGRTIDIHGGGQDLIFPHHENEIAQGTCAHGGELYCRTWLHNGFINVNREKMSKSIGNVTLVHDLLKDWPGEAIRLALLSTHYRQPLDWTEDTLPQARQVLDKWYRALVDVEPLARPDDLAKGRDMIEALSDDLNTPKAIAVLHQLARDINRAGSPTVKKEIAISMLACAELLGVLQDNPANWFQRGQSAQGVDASQIDALIEQRNAARKARDFAAADRIRNELAAMGIAIEDSAEGTSWRRI